MVSATGNFGGEGAHTQGGMEKVPAFFRSGRTDPQKQKGGEERSCTGGKITGVCLTRVVELCSGSKKGAPKKYAGGKTTKGRFLASTGKRDREGYK